MQKTRHYIKAIAIAIVAMATMSGCTDDDTQQAYDLNGYWQGSIQGDYYSDRYGGGDSWDTEIWFVQDGDFSNGGYGREIDYARYSGIVSAAIYGFCLIFLYLMSTIYHAITNSTAKKIFQVLDHCSIFLLILGSYVPICIVLLPPELGWKLLGINLLLTVVGITLNAISLSRWEKLSLLMYVLMGWSVIIALPYLWKMLPADGLMLLVSGGLAYTIGIFFYADKKHKFMHSVWHLFVMTGSVLHYFFVLYFIL